MFGSFATSFAEHVFAIEDTFQISQLITGTSTPTTTGPGGGGTTTPSTGGGGSSTTGGSIELQLLYFTVEPGTEAATIRFGTNLEVQPTISWGLTQDYELGTLSSALFLRDNSIRLEDLMPDTKYYFKVRLLDQFGRVRVIENQFFNTLPLFNIFSPENVSNFRAVASAPDTSENITLSWRNPSTQFELIRVVRSDKFYPRDPFEGKVVYEGTAEKFVDTDVVVGTRYYYTAFTKDAEGNYSSGAVADAILGKLGEEEKPSDLFGDVLLLSKDLINPIIDGLSLSDIDFIQDGKKLPIVSNTVDIRSDRSLKISIDYAKVPEILKTIAVTLYDPSDSTKTFSFLLRVNKDKTAYEAVIGALERPGKYSFGIAILDLKNQGLKKMAGVFVATVPELVWDKGNNVFDTFVNRPLYPFFLILSLFTIVLFALFFRRKTKVVVASVAAVAPTVTPTQSENK